MSAWSLSNTDRDRERFWRTPPPDPTRPFRQSGTPYYAKRSHGSRANLTPSDFMPLGPHAGKHLHAVPRDYLLWVNAQPWATPDRWPHWAPIADFISRYLLDASDSDNPTRPPTPTPTPTPTRPRSLDSADTQDTAKSPAGNGVPPLGGSESVLFYVDRLRKHPTTIRCFRAGSSHLHTLPVWEDYLHTFALGALGLQRQWYQNGALPHYDLTVGKHQQALQYLTVQQIPDRQMLDHRDQWLQFFSTKPQLPQ